MGNQRRAGNNRKMGKIALLYVDNRLRIIGIVIPSCISKAKQQGANAMGWIAY